MTKKSDKVSIFRKDLKKIAELLESAKLSEDFHDYAGEDGWGPAMGLAANRAKRYNNQIDKLIASIKESLK